MSVQNFTSASDARITPASASFEAAAVATDDNLIGVCSIVSAFDTLSTKDLSDAPQITSPEDTIEEVSSLPESQINTSDNDELVEPTECVASVSLTNPYDLESQVDKDSSQPQLKRPAAEDTKGAAVAGVDNIDHRRNGAGSAEALKTSAREAEYARNNWLELRARVQNADPRVFAFQEDPKYLQQCEDAKQRRTLAAATSISPSWH